MTLTVTYTPQATPIYAETTLVKSTDINNSVVFIEKQEGWYSCNLTYNKNLLSVTSKIEIEKIRNGYRLKTNTTNIIGTNIFDTNGIPYYYKIKSNAILTDSLMAFTTVYSTNGTYYTNDNTFNNFEVEKGIFLYVEPVYYLIDEDFAGIIKHEFTTKFIRILFKTSDTCVFKTVSDLVFSPLLLNKNTVLFPSFYLDRARYIEGNVLITNKIEYSEVDGNIINPKSRIISNNTSDTIVNTSTNSLYIDHYKLSTTNILIQYLAKTSSHVFNFNNAILYLKLSPLMIELGTSSDYDIAIQLKINLDKISVIPSEYFTEYFYTNSPQDIIFLNSSIDLNEIEKVSFKKYIKGDFNVFPSMIQYVQEENQPVIYQHTNNHNIPNGLSIDSIQTNSPNFNSTTLLEKSNTVYVQNEGVSFVLKYQAI
jgi:hypothetical protein